MGGEGAVTFSEQVVIMEMTVFGVVATCSLLTACHGLGGTYCLHLYVLFIFLKVEMYRFPRIKTFFCHIRKKGHLFK
jgi:hypothetical protein